MSWGIPCVGRSGETRAGLRTREKIDVRIWAVEAPGWRGARRRNTRRIATTSNEASRDGSAVPIRTDIFERVLTTESTENTEA